MKASEPLSIKQNVIWNGIGSLFYQGSLWLVTVLVVILSSSYENSGILAYAMTVGNIFGTLATYNMRTFQVSDVANRFSAHNYVAFRFITITSALAVCIVYAVVVTWSLNLVVTIVLFLLFKSDESFSIVLYAVDQKAYRMDYIGVSQIIRGTFVLLAFSAGLVFADSLNVSIVSMFVLCLGVTLIYDIPHASRLDAIKPRIEASQVKELFVTCLPAVLSVVFCGMVVAVSRQYFGNVYGNEALGIYAAVATPSVIVQLCAQYLYSPILGPIAEQWTNGTREGLHSLLVKLLAMMLLIIAAIVVALSFCGDFLLTAAFGQSISEYTYLFPPVLVGTGLIAFAWFFSDLLIVFREMKLALAMNAVNLAVALGSMVPLIDAFYMNGINYTIILANGVAIVLALVFVVRSIRVRYQ